MHATEDYHLYTHHAAGVHEVSLGMTGSNRVGKSEVFVLDSIHMRNEIMDGFLLLLATYTVVLMSFATHAPKAESYQFVQHNIDQESAVVC